MTKQNFELNPAEMTLSQLRKKERETCKKFKKYHVKITMIKPYEHDDFWYKKPNVASTFEVFMDELSTSNLTEYFKLEVNEI